MKKILKFIQHHGLLEFFRRAKSIFLKNIYLNREVLIFKARNDIDYSNIPHIEELSKSDIKKMIKVMYLSAEEINKRFDNGDKCYAVMEGKNIATYIWGQFKNHWMEELLLTFNLSDNQTWLYNVVTVNEARGKGYYTNILRYLGKLLQEKGYTEIYGYAEKQNFPSIKGLKKAGYVLTLNIHLKKIFTKIEYKVTVFDKKVWNQLRKTIINPKNSEWIVNYEQSN